MPELIVLSCPECQMEIHYHQTLIEGDEQGPVDGDMGICSRCATVYIYQEGHESVRLADPSDIEEQDQKQPGYARAIDHARWMIQRFHGIG